MLYTGRSISCADKTNAQALRSERSTCAAKYFSVARRLGRNPRPGFVAKSAPRKHCFRTCSHSRLETSCFQPFSAAGFSRSFVSARLNSLPSVKQNPWAAFLVCTFVHAGLCSVNNTTGSFFRLYRRRLSGMVGHLPIRLGVNPGKAP